MATIPFPPFAPDSFQPGTPVAEIMWGCFPTESGYAPSKSITDLTASLPKPCRGYFYARNTDGSITVFAGTEDRLYRLKNTDLTWVDVSKSGSAYSTLAANDLWVFRQFNALVIAVQIGTVPQVYNLSSDTQFSNLGGSPPACRHVAIINRFVVLTGIASNPRRVQWSDLDGPTTWTAGVGLSDFQDLADGGNTLGICGGDSYGAVFQEATARTFIYAPGSPYTFQIGQIGEGEILLGQYTPIAVGDRVFYVSSSGFKMILGAGGAPQPIGKDRVDATFAADIDKSALYLLQTAVDPQATRVYFTYKSIQGQAGMFDKILSYDWAVSAPKNWSMLPVSGEMIGSLSKPGLTLEALDPIAPVPIVISGAASGTAGRVRLTVDTLDNGTFKIAGQNWIQVYGVTGTTEANGTWVPIVIDATHIELTGSVFANAYVSGGNIGGSLDALPFSLDDVSTAAVAAASIVTSAHKVGFFDGPNMEAILETPEQDGENEQLVFVSGIRPITDCAVAKVSLSKRNRAQDARVYTAEVGIDAAGKCNIMAEARYITARLRIPAAATWNYAKGVQPIAQAAGDF